MKIKRIFSKLSHIVPLKKNPVVPVISMRGVIEDSNGVLNTGLSLAKIVPHIDEAFEYPGAKAVALIINSPGGSPVQSALIAKRIQDLSKEKDLPVIAFTEDVAASGGYMLALAASEIYAHEASIVGSIGVFYGGFGFNEAIARFGIERRLYTAGARKAMLDQFSPQKEEDVARIKEIQRDIHEYFKAFVRTHRGKRLSGDEDIVFSGDVFLGQEAVKYGLVDGIGDVRTVLRKRFGDKVMMPLIEDKKQGLSKFLKLGLSHKSHIDSDLGYTAGYGIVDAMAMHVKKYSYSQRLGL